VDNRHEWRVSRYGRVRRRCTELGIETDRRISTWQKSSATHKDAIGYDKYHAVTQEVSAFIDLAPIAGVVSPVFGFARDISLLGEPPEEKFVLISRYGGESVAQLLRSKANDHTLPLANATEFGAAMRSVVAIVKQLHAAGIAHGDLHSGNLLWERDEKRFSLVDFGLSVGSATWRHRISDYERLLGIGLRMVLRRCRQLDRDAAALNPLRLLQSDTAAPYLDELRHIAREAFELMFAGAPAETRGSDATSSDSSALVAYRTLESCPIQLIR
jgi:serine/threonine protein kinase